MRVNNSSERMADRDGGVISNGVPRAPWTTLLNSSGERLSSAGAVSKSFQVLVNERNRAAISPSRSTRVTSARLS